MQDKGVEEDARGGSLSRCSYVPVFVGELAAVREGLRLQYKEIDVGNCLVRPGYTKTNRYGGRFLIRLKKAEEGKEIFLRIVPELIIVYEGLGVDLRSYYLFRAGRGVNALGGGAFNKRVEKWFGEAGVYEGESNHSFRIGGLQAGIEDGWSLGEMMRQGTLSSIGMFMRYGYGVKRGWKRNGEVTKRNVRNAEGD
ncbi:hypothetical protein CBR_g49400 [Chara braunii]|uniref:Uncharacterized protein n=1 Tax=Chara braunii TaxID=69332 RepID=A0A388M503_CHABU|nr:hypothetical protein CBR_g49400 [Chara braunii]|eukprot:GBG89610.1 hypothetical protein CBR_g49400 [Chara braunii]